MTNTELFDQLMLGYGKAAEDVAQIAGKHEKLAGAVLRSHSAAFLRLLVTLLEPDPEQSKFADNINTIL